MNIKKDRWQLNELLSHQKQEYLHILLQSAGFRVHEWILDNSKQNYKNYLQHSPQHNKQWPNIYHQKKVDEHFGAPITYNELVTALTKYIQEHGEEI